MIDIDVDSFILFASTARGWLLAFAYSLCGDHYEAEDLVQVALLNIYVHWERLTDRGQLAGYSRRTLLRVYLNAYRRRRQRPEVIVSDVPDRGHVEPSVDSRLALRSAVDTLGRRQRAVILLRFWADLSVEQTAAVLNCSTGTVSSQTYHALRRLRTLLGTPESPEDSRLSHDAVTSTCPTTGRALSSV